MPMNILVVDDEPDIQFLITQKFRKQIQAETFCFVFAEDGAVALQQLTNTPEVYVVLCDINMPGMDGLALLTEISARFPLVRTIIISAYGDMYNIRMAMNRGAYDFLLKPIDFDDLEMTLNRAVRHIQQDIQEIRAHHDLETQLLQLQKAIENMQLGVTVIDLEGKILYTNPADARMHGYTVDELLGKDVGIFAPPDLRNPMRLDDIKLWKGLIRESVNIRRDGTLFPVWLMSEIVRDASGEPTAIVTSCEDITERKRAQQELERHREHLEELVKERTIELTAANEQLQQEIGERKRVEMELRTTYQSLKDLNDRLQEELSFARKIQQSLLPPSDPSWSNLDVVCYSTPAYEVGGDFYAYHAFQEETSLNCTASDPERGQYAIAVGDISGKGMPAALLMAVSLASFQESIGHGLTPCALMAHLDETIMPYTKTTLQNCALVYVEIALPEGDTPGNARVVNAGCITPIICRVNGVVEWIDAGGMPLGIGAWQADGYQEVTIPLAHGDVIILTSDGVIEAHNPADELLGFERFEAAVQSAPQTTATDMLTHLLAYVNQFREDAELHDDLTLVVIRV